MCGFAAELKFDGQAADIAAVSAMALTLARRGPDGEGLFAQGPRAFAQLRLKIMDLSEHAQQPMFDPLLGLGVVFNGAIYNHPELRAELRSKGYQFYSEGDTEVILKAYHAWGKDCVKHFQGMFAFVLWERDSGRTVLARDRLGIKPMYLHASGKRLRAASTLPALLAGGGVSHDIDPVALHRYLSFHAVVPPPHTILKDVRKLPPATVRVIEADGSRRYPPRDAADNPAGAEPLSEAEVAVLLRNALRVARQGRAQIRRPLGSQIHVTASVVDSRGAVLGVLRTHDGPIFGTDVSLQKARTAVFFSSDDAGQRLSDGGAVSYLDIARDNNGDLAIDRRAPALAFADYVQRTRDLFGPTALTGTHAFADRSGGNLSRPFFPDGLLSAPPGPFSKPFADWSPFSTGLQLDMVYERIIQHVAFTLGLVPDVSDSGCTGGFPAGTDAAPLFFGTTIPEGLDNGLQIFPGSVPIYRGGVLVGGIGISGDGVDQDDMIAFLGTHNAGLELGGALGNAPPEIRADRLEARGVRLRYVQCPQAPGAPNPPPDVAGPRFPETPFPGSDQQRVCEGL